MNLDYQTNSSLQAFPNLTSTENKVFLLIYQHSLKYNGRVFMSREYMASVIGISVTHISRITKRLQKEFGLIAKTVTAYDYKRRRCNYAITELGHQASSYIIEAYNLFKKVFLSISLLFSPGTSNVTLVNLNGVRFKNGCISVRELQTAREENHPSTTLLPVTKKETVMQIPDYVEKLTDTLKLTPHGKIKLSIFNEPTIEHGFAAIQKTVKCKDVFAEMVNQCTVFAKENGYKVSWGVYYDAVEAKKIDRTQFYTLKKITSEMVKPRKSIFTSENPVYFSRVEDLMAFLRKGVKDRVAECRPDDIERERRYIQSNPEWAVLGIKLGVDFSRYNMDSQPVTKIHDFPKSVTNRHDLESSKVVSSGGPNRTIIELAGIVPQNMVEPEPVEYEQDSIWEEV